MLLKIHHAQLLVYLTPFKSAVDNPKNKEVIEKSKNEKKLSTLMDQVKSLETNLG